MNHVILAGAWKGAKELGVSKTPSQQGAKELPLGFLARLGYDVLDMLSYWDAAHSSCRYVPLFWTGNRQLEAFFETVSTWTFGQGQPSRKTWAIPFNPLLKYGT